MAVGHEAVHFDVAIEPVGQIERGITNGWCCNGRERVPVRRQWRDGAGNLSTDCDRLSVRGCTYPYRPSQIITSKVLLPLAEAPTNVSYATTSEISFDLEWTEESGL